MIYFKVQTGYGPNEFIPIDETQLEAAQYAFLTESKAILGGVPVRGKDIMTIIPDVNRMMGWNRGYKMEAEDHAIWNASNKSKQTDLFLRETSQKVNARLGSQHFNNPLLN